ncbi:hypothetical protein AVDCRST_MAG92-386 [uncultured Coleofasciculus sp.]|uniref:Uncharacterized protein n=1 Tax=uncultured Coleofasciculus sp. TaxID=1267456 RepID=A0A6J4H8V5_9CYAN|nr:hypothetical protein AVDCRST_MAG92-386 [uncultured Coleofasciculus sp.]
MRVLLSCYLSNSTTAKTLVLYIKKYTFRHNFRFDQLAIFKPLRRASNNYI